jgi:hypothetical protein
MAAVAATIKSVGQIFIGGRVPDAAAPLKPEKEDRL